MMSDEGADAGRLPDTAGGLLRQARQAQGLHIAALAAAIKVSQRKLELLESDQIDALPDATFARALAQTVCRALKIDPAPVLALLPPPSGYRLEQLGEGLNTPYRDQSGALAASSRTGLAGSTLWVAILLVVAAGVVYLLPPNWIERVQAVVSPAADPDTSLAVGAASAPQATASAPVAVSPTQPAAATGSARAVAAPALSASTASTPSTASNASAEPVVPPVVAAPALALAAEVATGVAASAAVARSASNASASLSGAAASAALPSGPGAGSPAGMLQLKTSAASWIEVIDASGKVLLSRVLAPDESLTLDGVAPFKLKIGNAAGTRLVFRNRPVELAQFTRNNVARLELK